MPHLTLQLLYTRVALTYLGLYPAEHPVLEDRRIVAYHQGQLLHLRPLTLSALL
jgi:hypothetical protein